MNKKSTTQTNNRRIFLHFKLMVWLLIVSIIGIIGLGIAGYHPGWVGFIASLGFAELSRRVLSEQNPDRAMSWRDVWRFTFTGELPDRKSTTEQDE